MKKILDWINQMLSVCFHEFRGVFKDSGVFLVIVGATIVYPLLYCAIYQNESIYDVPIAVVDECRTSESRELLRRINVSPDVAIATSTATLEEARSLFEDHKVHGIVCIPSDFSERLALKEQATISTYCDMSSFLYYRSMAMATNYAVLDMGQDIQVNRLAQAGVTGQSAAITVTPIPNQETILFNSGGGFFSFFMPVILILILHQTLFFGISMRSGQAREDGNFRKLLPQGSSVHRIMQVVTGKSLCYFAIYAVLTSYVVGIVPRLFSLPHLGNALDLMFFMVPFLLAVIFFAITLSVFMRNRETGLVSLLFFSVILLFVSGFSWPQSNINGFWRAFGYIFPSTHAIQGYIKINTMGATLRQVSPEYIALWVQAAVYFVTACFALKPRKVADGV